MTKREKNEEVCGRVYYDKDHLPASYCHLPRGHVGPHGAKLRGGTAIYEVEGQVAHPTPHREDERP